MHNRLDPNLFDQCVRIRVFVPKAHVSSIRSALDQLAQRFSMQSLFVGTLGNYDAVRYETPTVENFVANKEKGARPYVETPSELVCLETWCSPGLENEVVSELRDCHPYEHPVIEVSTAWLAKPKQNDSPG